jgi:hypothetical protein
MTTVPLTRRLALRSSAPAALLAILAWAVLLLVATPAQAGTWIQVSCVNPDGSAAPSEGWTAGATGSPEAGSSGSARCPMYGELSPIGGAAKVGDSEYVQYQPPDGSKLIGGVANMTLSADSGGSASGDAVLYEPALAYPSDVFFQCAAALGACGPPSSPNDTTGNIFLPSDAGGAFIAQATCGGNSGGLCNQHVTGATASSPWSSVQVNWAHFILSNNAVPAASGFSGTALEPGVRGTGNLLFSATDTGGPGVYAVTASIDGTPVWSGTPNTNGGACVAVGSDSGALMFDEQQPCPAAEAVSIPIATTGLPDGKHVLAVSVSDAAGNASPVLDQTITTTNPQTTPNPSGRRALHARFVISWHWDGASTLLRSIRVTHLLRGARVAVHCVGRHCPRLRAGAKGSRRVAKMLRKLGGRRLRAGQSLLITVTAPRRQAERIAVRIRDGLKPSARLLR